MISSSVVQRYFESFLWLLAVTVGVIFYLCGNADCFKTYFCLHLTLLLRTCCCINHLMCRLCPKSCAKYPYQIFLRIKLTLCINEHETVYLMHEYN